MRARPIRLAGMSSGMDTDSMVRDMMRPQQYKIDQEKKAQALVKLKQDAWNDMNKKMYDFHRNFTDKLRRGGSFNKSTATSSNESAIAIENAGSMPEGTHQFEVTQLATSTSAVGDVKVPADGKLSAQTTMANLLGGDPPVDKDMFFGMSIWVGGEEVNVEVKADESIKTLTSRMNTALRGKDVRVSFDEHNKKFFVNSTTTGEKDITFSVDEYTKTKIDDKYEIDEPKVANNRILGSLGLLSEGKSIGRSISNMVVPAGVKLSDKTTVANLLGGEPPVDGNKTFGMKIIVNGEKVEVSVKADSSIDELQSAFNTALKDKGIEVSFDVENKKFIVKSNSATISTDEISFEGYADVDVEDGTGILTSLGLTGGEKVALSPTISGGQGSEYTYNGVEFKSDSNIIQVNGIHATLKAETLGEVVTISAERDVDGIYDFVKGFITEYNELIGDLNEKVRTKPTMDIEPLTAEERDSMSDSEIKLWEDRLNESLFYRDPSIQDFLDTSRGNFSKDYNSGIAEGQEGRMLYGSLASLGIVSGNWEERGKLHIGGDEDDPLAATGLNRLREAIENNPDEVMELFNKLGQDLYTTTENKLKSSKLNSAFKFYNDRVMDEEVKNFDKRISTLEDRMYQMEERHYAKFAAMERMLHQLNSQGNWLAQQFGGM